MIKEILFYIASVMTLGWGIAHLFPTKSVVRGFGEISEDNRNIIRMEWITEGVALIFLGILVVAITLFGDIQSLTARIAYAAAVFMLIAMTLVSVQTGFKVNFLPYKLCPFLFGTSALLLFIGVII
ncbi:MAG: hypothetical protein D4R67_09545 [Bacteroidetes bacterium]|nr:MAG: hypothetical protein D4R67_09545 [Bacteroidota bacterium]